MVNKKMVNKRHQIKAPDRENGQLISGGKRYGNKCMNESPRGQGDSIISKVTGSITIIVSFFCINIFITKDAACNEAK
jgi:hypothetical protein